MARQSGAKGSQRSPVVSLRNQGFTLTEVLVVLAIMVILFGMLFVPITTSIEMTRTAQYRSQMNQTMRLAMEQVRRELSDAAAFYLPEYIPLGDGTYIINYCNITFIPQSQVGAASPRVVRYAVHTPEATRNPQTLTVGSITYLVEQPTTIDNPFVLYRQEGYMNLIDGRNYFGSDLDPDGAGPQPAAFVAGFPLSENALTPVRDADIPVTETICLDDTGIIVPPLAVPTDLSVSGYVNPGDVEAVFGIDGEQLVYIHGGIQFSPLRVEGETMQVGANNTVYTATHGNWAGLYNDGTQSLADLLTAGFIIKSSELRPRIVVQRAGAVFLDTDTMTPPNLLDDIRYNSQRGTVSVWLPPGGPATAQAVFDLSSIPGPGVDWTLRGVPPSTADIQGTDTEYTKVANRTEPIVLPGAAAGSNWIPLTNTNSFTDGEAITINPDGGTEETCTIVPGSMVNGAGFQVSILLAWGHGAGEVVQADEKSAKAPSIYTIDPGGGDKMIVPESVRVWVQAYDHDAPQMYSLEYVPVYEVSQDDLGYGQFLPEAVGGGTNYTTMMIKFANSSADTPPPSPEDQRTYGAPSTFDWENDLTDNANDYFRIVVQYQYRRNFASPNVDDYDEIIVSYSTREVYNVALEVMPYRHLEDNDGDLVWQPHGPATGVQMRAQVEVRNLSR